MRILLVEDEVTLQNVMALNLRHEGYEVVTTQNGLEAIELFKKQHFDLILLDVMIPGMDGFQVCERIRLLNQRVSILFTTARVSSADRIAGLKLGADDYIIKPFNLEELLLRVQIALKRGNSAVETEMQMFRWADFWINFNDFKALTLSGEVDLTPKETMLLRLFAERKNEVISRAEILQAVWGYDVYPSTRTIDNFILSFRKYFEENPREPQFFKSIRGVGYKFDVPT